jgi:F-type H+-transporting ATPase subunit epsilon
MTAAATMTVTLRLPARLFHESPVSKLTARAENGGFGVLPNHVDFVTALAPGVMMLTGPDGEETVFGIDEGIFVKHDRQVDICVRRVTQGTDLASLKATVRENFVEVDEQERAARSALARLEANMVRQFTELKKLR